MVKMKIYLILLLGIIPNLNIFSGDTETVMDADGNTYTILSIGDQEWMGEDLKTTKFNDGESIPMITDNAEWHEMNSEALALYNNIETAYGALYNGFAVETGKLCPQNWHVPTVEDWQELATNLNGRDIPGTKILMNGELKSTSVEPASHPRWDLPNVGASDANQFAALPGGQRNYLGEFYYRGKFGFWWTSSTDTGDDDEELGYYFGLRYDDPDLFLVSGNKKNGFSVRCVKSD